MSHITATAEVPPKASINLQANAFLVSIPDIIGAPNICCQGVPNRSGDKINVMTPLTERFKIFLELAGGSVTNLAEIAGVKPPSVSDWKNGKTKTLKGRPSSRIANRWNLNPIWVAEGRGDMRLKIPANVSAQDQRVESLINLFVRFNEEEQKEALLHLSTYAMIKGYVEIPEFNEQQHAQEPLNKLGSHSGIQ